VNTLSPVDQDQLFSQLMELAELREPAHPGWTRRTFSEPYRRSRGWTARLMERAGLGVRADPVGNLLGDLPGSEPGLPQIVVGSHTDTVAGGGRFDGMVGVLGAVEVARVLQVSGHRLRHPLLVADFLGEEPNRFGLSCVGSRAVSGQLSPAHLELRDEQGESLAEALSAFGSDPERIELGLWSPDQLWGYLELHIEQGTRLERAGVPLGVVTAITGIHRAVVTFTGRPDHAGTATMEERRDALAAAAEAVLAVEWLAGPTSEGDSGVGTVGRLELTPGVANVVPGWARVWAELRSPDAALLAERHRSLEGAVVALAARRGVEAVVEWVSSEPPVVCHPGMRQLITEAIRELGFGQMEVPSGASHDAAPLSRLCPVGMIFIPSRQGRSHCQEEWSEPGQVAVGAEALLASVLALDQDGSL
jgi:N-carbamoyl-L-amino-acid hydrolase